MKGENNMNKREFEIGDKVKIVSTDSYFAPIMEGFIGQKGVIRDVDNKDNTYLVSINGKTWWYEPDSLEPLYNNDFISKEEVLKILYEKRDALSDVIEKVRQL